MYMQAEKPTVEEKIYWRSPRELLKKVIHRYQAKADRRDIYRFFKRELLKPENKEYLDAVIGHWFTNNFAHVAYVDGLSVSPKAKPEPIPAAVRKKQAAKKLEAVKAVIKARAEKLVLLELVQANGKKLADCTGRECLELGGKLHDLGMKIGENECVKDVFTEEKLQKFWLSEK